MTTHSKEEFNKELLRQLEEMLTDDERTVFEGDKSLSDKIYLILDSYALEHVTLRDDQLDPEDIAFLSNFPPESRPSITQARLNIRGYWLLFLMRRFSNINYQKLIKSTIK